MLIQITPQLYIFSSYMTKKALTFRTRFARAKKNGFVGRRDDYMLHRVQAAWVVAGQIKWLLAVQRAVIFITQLFLKKQAQAQSIPQVETGLLARRALLKLRVFPLFILLNYWCLKAQILRGDKVFYKSFKPFGRNFISHRKPFNLISS